MNHYSKHKAWMKNAVSSPREYTDEQLAALCRNTQPVPTDAFATLVRRYEREIYRSCFRYLHHHADAQDACQEVLVRLCRHLEHFQGRSSFRTWLHRVVQNQCHSLAAKRARQVMPEELVADWVQAQLAGERDALADDHRETVAEALKRLSATDREVLKRRFFQEQTLEQIAIELELGLSAAKMRLYRALDRLKLQLIAFRLPRQPGQHNP